MTAFPDIKAPKAARIPHDITQHGETRIDPYDWLRGEGKDLKEILANLSPEIREYLEAENAYQEAMTAHFDALTEQVGEELVSRIIPNDSSTPLPDGPYTYWKEFRPEGNYAVYMRRENASGQDEIIFDGDAEGKDQTYFGIGNVLQSPDHKMIATAIDYQGKEMYSVRFRDLETGRDYPETIEMTSEGELVWSADSSMIYYIEKDDQDRPKRVRSHIIGTDPKDDPIVYDEPDDGYFLHINKSASGEYLFITTNVSATSEVRFLRTDAPQGTEPTLAAERVVGTRYLMEHGGDTFYILTNQDGAVEYKIMTTPVAAYEPENWTDLFPYDPKVNIIGMHPFKDYLVTVEKTDALTSIMVRPFNGEPYAVELPDPIYTVAVIEGFEFETDSLKLSYSTMVNPGVTYDLNMKTGEKTVIKEKVLPSGLNAENYVTERLFVPARDGVEIPVTILRLKDTPIDGTAPLFQYGYGSYGLSREATFYSSAFSLVDRGVIYAIAHIRGGGDMGKGWYLDGRLDRKMNTFNDFIDVTKALVEQGYGKKGEVCIEGGSAGGMLMGAVANMAPEYYGGVTSLVPFVDVVNTISDPSLPLTPPEWPEWGNPIEDEKAYRYMMSYSPYDNVSSDKTYPPIFAVCGLNDPRVTYWEPAKWIARLRAEGQGGPFLLKTNMGSGHFGSAARYELMRELAPRIAFALDRYEDMGYDISLRDLPKWQGSTAEDSASTKAATGKDFSPL